LPRIQFGVIKPPTFGTRNPLSRLGSVCNKAANPEASPTAVHYSNTREQGLRAAGVEKCLVWMFGFRKVFCINQDPIIDSVRLLDFRPLENADEVIEQRLANSLKSPPEFDPEGWASIVYRGS
jgi:hypothetical protein